MAATPAVTDEVMEFLTHEASNAYASGDDLYYTAKDGTEYDFQVTQVFGSDDPTDNDGFHALATVLLDENGDETDQSVFVTRGTSGYPDSYADIDENAVGWSLFMAHKDEVLAWYNDQKDAGNEVGFTGTSLGGVLSQMFSGYIHQETGDTLKSVVTFSSPGIEKSVTYEGVTYDFSGTIAETVHHYIDSGDVLMQFGSYYIEGDIYLYGNNYYLDQAGDGGKVVRFKDYIAQPANQVKYLLSDAYSIQQAVFIREMDSSDMTGSWNPLSVTVDETPEGIENTNNAVVTVGDNTYVFNKAYAEVVLSMAVSGGAVDINYASKYVSRQKWEEMRSTEEGRQDFLGTALMWDSTTDVNVGISGSFSQGGKDYAVITLTGKTEQGKEFLYSFSDGAFLETEEVVTDGNWQDIAGAQTYTVKSDELPDASGSPDGQTGETQNKTYSTDITNEVLEAAQNCTSGERQIGEIFECTSQDGLTYRLKITELYGSDDPEENDGFHATGLVLLDVDGVTETDEHFLIFRGTSGFPDAIADFYTDAPGLPLFAAHTQEVLDWYEKYEGEKITFTGSSFGSGLAQYFAGWLVNDEGKDQLTRLVGFSSPAIVKEVTYEGTTYHFITDETVAGTVDYYRQEGDILGGFGQDYQKGTIHLYGSNAQLDQAEGVKLHEYISDAHSSGTYLTGGTSALTLLDDFDTDCFSKDANYSDLAVKVDDAPEGLENTNINAITCGDQIYLFNTEYADVALTVVAYDMANYDETLEDFFEDASLYACQNKWEEVRSTDKQETLARLLSYDNNSDIEISAGRGFTLGGKDYVELANTGSSWTGNFFYNFTDKMFVGGGHDLVSASSLGEQGGVTFTINGAEPTVALAGEVITLTAQKVDGYECVSFASDDVTISADNTFTMPEGTVTVTAIYVKYGDRITVDNTYTAENPYELTTGKTYAAKPYAGNGGMVYVEEGGNLNTNGASFACIKVTGGDNDGGAIYISKGAVNVSGGSFTSNTAGHDGGAIYNKGGTMVISGADFTGNSAGQLGGAIATSDGKLDITSANFTGNTANSGGAIWNLGGKTILGNVTFCNNTAAGGGGAIYGGDIDLVGDVYLSSDSDTIWMEAGKTLNWTIDGNDHGYVSDYKLIIGNVTAETFTVDAKDALLGHCYILAGNAATSKGQTFTVTVTGAAGVEEHTMTVGGETLQMGDDSYVLGVNDSGELYLSVNRHIVVSDYDVIIHSVQDFSWEGMDTYTGNGSLFEFKESGSMTNVVVEEETSYSSAVSFSNGSVGKDDQGKGGNGGIIYNEGSVTLDASYFEANTAEGNGGAIYSSNTLYVTDGSFFYNEAEYGGAVYIAGGTGNYLSGTFEGNAAVEQGGAVYLASGAALTLGDTTFENNEADEGGAIYSEGNILLTGELLLSTSDDSFINYGTVTLDYASGASIRGYQYLANADWDAKVCISVEGLGEGEEIWRYAFAKGNFSGDYEYVDEFTLTDGTNQTTITVGGGLVELNGHNYSIDVNEAGDALLLNAYAKKDISITLHDMEKKYDGVALTCTDYEISGTLGSDDELVVTISDTITNAGTKDVEVSSWKVLRDGVDVSYEYNLTSTGATLTVTQRDVTLTSESASKVYDGTPLTNDTMTVGGSGWADGEGAVYTVTGSQTEIGSSANTFTYELNNGTLADNYTIETVEGTLTVISPIEYTLSESVTTTYDGNEHGVTVTVTNPPTGASVYYSVDGGENWTPTATSSYMLTDATDGAVSVSFKIEAEGYGSVTTDSRTINIDPKRIRVRGTTAESKVYDGTTAATVNPGTLEGVVDGDDVTLAATGRFGTPDVGADKTVTVRYTLEGDDAGNYKTIVAETLHADILKAPVSNYNHSTKSDMIQFVDGFVYVTYDNGEGVYQQTAAINDVTGWDVAEIRRDLTGDGLADMQITSDDGNGSTWVATLRNDYLKDDTITLNYQFIGAYDNELWSYLGSADVNGDGKAEVLMIQTDAGLDEQGHRNVAAWVTDETGTWVGNEWVGALESNWNVAGTADLDGNGTDDVILRRDDGMIGYWNNAGSNEIVEIAESGSNVLITTGDFSGDGADDFLFTNASGDFLTWSDVGGALKSETIGNIDQLGGSWGFAGAGDYNGDGKEEILWCDGTNTAYSEATQRGFAKLTQIA